MPSVLRLSPLRRLISILPAVLGPAILALCASLPAMAVPCTGPGAPTTTETKCLTAIAIPGNPLRSFDISWVDSKVGLYFLADRSNSGVDIISTATNKFIGRAPGFAGIALTSTGAVNNNLSGPDGVVSRGNCLFAGDGDSTLKVFDISNPANPQMVGTPFNTGGTTRLDEMALDTDGTLLFAVNNAEDPPFGTLFAVNPFSCGVAKLAKIEADFTVIPPGLGLSIEQPAWDPLTQRFFVSVPTIANNPTGCIIGGSPSCSGGILVIDPTNLVDPIEKVVPLHQCGPNGATVGPYGNVMFGCTPNNQPGDAETTIINTITFHYVDVGNLTGSDEVWFNKGSNRYYTGSSAMPGGAVLGVVNGTTNFLVETIPQSSASHSVAADSRRNEIYVPQVAPKSVVGIGGDITTVGQGICGTTNGCVAVYVHRHIEDGEDSRE